MRYATRILAWAIASLIAAAAVADESHQDGEARWDSVVLSQLSDVCRLTGLDRAIELGTSARRNPRGDAHDCVASSAWIHNTSQRPLYCRAVLKLRKPDDSGRTEISGQDFILPNARRNLATAYGEAKRAPSNAVTTCEVKSDTYLAAPPSCDLQILSVPDPNLYYPEESRRRTEEGDVTLDFRVDMSARKPRDLRVSGSSGYRSLDLAALRVGRKMVTTATCPGVRGTIQVNFRLAADDAESMTASPPAN